MTRQTSEPGRLPDVNLRARLDYDDARLLAECAIDFCRVRGPGGQHRNKTDSGVRLHHKPSGVMVTATERRSQHENKANAIVRLREALAVQFRAPPPEKIVWPPSVQIQAQRLKCGEKNEAFYHVLALALDALAFEQGKLAEAAARLGVTSSSLARFLADHPKAWAEANRIRQAAGLSSLKA